jgi:cell division protein FtsZ
VADDILRQAVQGISDIITIPGIINRDFADVKTIMAGMGYAVMGTATAKGEDRASKAAQAAIASPLLEAGAIDGARGILINVTGSSSLRLAEVNEASTIIQSAAHEDANIIFGAVLDEKMKDEVKITVIATGFKDTPLGRQHPNPTATSVLQSARPAPNVQGTYEVSGLRNAEPVPAKPAPAAAPEPVRPPQFEPVSPAERPRAIQYVPESYGDVDSEIVRHAMPKDEVVSHRAYSHEAEAGYSSTQRERAFAAAAPAPAKEEPQTIETVSSSVNINYDADDLEIPAFLRKRGEG